MKKRVRKSFSDMKRSRVKNTLIICSLFLPVILYLFYCAGGMFEREITAANFEEVFQWCLRHPLGCYNKHTGAMVLSGFCVWMIFTLSYYTKINNNLMPGKEFGEAKWGDIRSFNRKYASENEMENRILSENIRFRYDASTLRNNNTFVCGGSGSGKTGFFLTPNLLNHHGSNIITDPKGSLMEELGNYLRAQEDTNVYCLNLCEMDKSMHINPFLFLEKPQDVLKLVTNLIQNTETSDIRTNSADPFWEKAERMLLYSVFTYVWSECPVSAVDSVTGEVFVLEKNIKSVLHLIAEAKIEDNDTPSLLDLRMKELEKREPNHPAVRAYNRYRSGPMETIRSVLMTVNARMQVFDNEDLLNIFSGNDIPLDELGVGKDGDGRTKSCLFMVIPDDDITYNFVPGMVYTMMFQILYRQARFFGGRLPIDVGFWEDEFANIKMPANYDKIMAGCRSRGIYCVPMLQSLSQMKKLFADGAWEGVVGNCDTFIYLGGNEQTTFEYISKLLGKWTIDKRTSGESKGSNGSVSENFDVLGRELMQEYEVRLLPDDECIIFVRGEEPLRDKKWFPWEHEEYEKARAYGTYDYLKQTSEQEESYRFLTDQMLDYQKKLAKNNPKIKIYNLDPMEFMKMDMDVLEKEHNRLIFEGDDISEEVPLALLSERYEEETQRQEEEQWRQFLEVYERLSLLDVFSFEQLSGTRKRVIQELLKLETPEKDIKDIVHPLLSEGEVLAKKKAYLSMHSIKV